MNIYNNLKYAFNNENIKIANTDEIPFLREEHKNGIYNEISVMPSGIDFGWSPLIALLHESEIIGYMHFDMTLPFQEDEDEYIEDSECNFEFYLKYIYIKEEFRGEGIFSQFIRDFLNEFTEQLSYNLDQTNYDTGYFTYSAEYVSDNGRYIGEMISEALEDFSSNHNLNYKENLN